MLNQESLLVDSRIEGCNQCHLLACESSFNFTQQEPPLSLLKKISSLFTSLPSSRCCVLNQIKNNFIHRHHLRYTSHHHHHLKYVKQQQKRWKSLNLNMFNIHKTTARPLPNPPTMSNQLATNLSKYYGLFQKAFVFWGHFLCRFMYDSKCYI